MKRLLPFAPLLLLAALLLSPDAALSGAKRGLDIWWGRVFPALLPSFICVRLAQSLGLLRLAVKRPRGQLILVAGFSLVSGAPNGAKLLHALVEDGSLTHRDAQQLLPLVNNVGPAFLLSIIASDLLKNKALVPWMTLAFYGTILVLLVPSVFRKRSAVASLRSAKAVPFSTSLSSAIETSMLDMLRIGGCILFICTLLSLVQPITPSERANAALAGLMEVSIGTTAISELSLPLRLKASLMMGAAAFGGLSLGLQTVCCYPELKLLPYLLKKLVFGGLVGLMSYLAFPLFPGVSTVFASRQEVLSRSLSISALLFSSILSVGFIAVLSLMMSSRHRT